MNKSKPNLRPNPVRMLRLVGLVAVAAKISPSVPSALMDLRATISQCSIVIGAMCQHMHDVTVYATYRMSKAGYGYVIGASRGRKN